MPFLPDQAQQAEAVRVHEVEQARRARIDARAAELDNVRRDACVKFLSLAATFRDVADEYGWMLEAPSTEQRRAPRTATCRPGPISPQVPRPFR